MALLLTEGVTSNRGAARATVVCKEKAVVERSAARRSFIAGRLKSCAQDVIGGSAESCGSKYRGGVTFLIRLGDVT
eukprot:scaffold1012_cov189-Alexandrium_tamarense.AAC.13